MDPIQNCTFVYSTRPVIFGGAVLPGLAPIQAVALSTEGPKGLHQVRAEGNQPSEDGAAKGNLGQGLRGPNGKWVF